MSRFSYRVWMKDRDGNWKMLETDFHLGSWSLVGLQQLAEGKDEARPLTHWCVEQSTGLLDISGKEIFEGDVVDSRQGYFVVEWLGEMAQFVFIWRTGHSTSRCAINQVYNKKILGNIHDNPELVGGAK